jgi:hypothetical protein
MKTLTTLCVRLLPAPVRWDEEPKEAVTPEELSIGFITSEGYTYLNPYPSETVSGGVARIPLASLRQSDTALLPRTYPVFLDKYFHPTESLSFDIRQIETLEVRYLSTTDERGRSSFAANVWLE